jgi:hypothetical protein
MKEQNAKSDTKPEDKADSKPESKAWAALFIAARSHEGLA